jgi:AcrR family transcriptional regulator
MAKVRPPIPVGVRRRRAPRGAGDQLRDEIINAAMALLVQTGCTKAVSIRSVAEKVGVTTPSIYLHFADKDGLLEAVCARHFETLDEQMRSAAAECTSASEAIHALGLAYVRFALKTPVLYEIATMARPRPHSAVDTVLATSTFTHLRGVIQTLIDDGVYPPGDADQLALELWTAVHGVTALFIAKPHWSREGVEHLADRVIRAMCCGQMAAGQWAAITPHRYVGLPNAEEPGRARQPSSIAAWHRSPSPSLQSHEQRNP